MERSNKHLEALVEQLTQRNEELQRERLEALTANDDLTTEKMAVIAENEGLAAENVALRKELSAMNREVA